MMKKEHALGGPSHFWGRSSVPFTGRPEILLWAIFEHLLLKWRNMPIILPRIWMSYVSAQVQRGHYIEFRAARMDVPSFSGECTLFRTWTVNNMVGMLFREEGLSFPFLDGRAWFRRHEEQGSSEEPINQHSGPEPFHKSEWENNPECSIPLAKHRVFYLNMDSSLLFSVLICARSSLRFSELETWSLILAKSSSESPSLIKSFKLIRISSYLEAKALITVKERRSYVLLLWPCSLNPSLSSSLTSTEQTGRNPECPLPPLLSIHTSIISKEKEEGRERRTFGDNQDELSGGPCAGSPIPRGHTWEWHYNGTSFLWVWVRACLSQYRPIICLSAWLRCVWERRALRLQLEAILIGISLEEDPWRDYLSLLQYVPFWQDIPRLRAL